MTSDDLQQMLDLAHTLIENVEFVLGRGDKPA